MHGTKLKEHLPFQDPHIVSCSVGMFPEKKVRFEKDETSLELAFAPAPKPDVRLFYNSASHFAKQQDSCAIGDVLGKTVPSQWSSWFMIWGRDTNKTVSLSKNLIYSKRQTFLPDIWKQELQLLLSLSLQLQENVLHFSVWSYYSSSFMCPSVSSEETFSFGGSLWRH